MPKKPSFFRRLSYPSSELRDNGFLSLPGPSEGQLEARFDVIVGPLPEHNRAHSSKSTDSTPNQTSRKRAKLNQGQRFP